MAKIGRISVFHIDGNFPATFVISQEQLPFLKTCFPEGGRIETIFSLYLFSESKYCGASSFVHIPTPAMSYSILDSWSSEYGKSIFYFLFGLCSCDVLWCFCGTTIWHFYPRYETYQYGVAFRVNSLLVILRIFQEYRKFAPLVRLDTVFVTY